MDRSTDRLNRVLVSIVGLLLMAAGVYVLLRSTGAIGDRDAPVLSNDIRDWARDHRRWLFAGAAALAAVIALLGLWWLVAQTRRWEHRSQDITYRAEQPAEWRATVTADALESMLTDEVEGHDAVQDVRARVHLEADEPHVELRVAAERGTDLPALTRWIDEEVLAEASGALERPLLPARIRYRLVEPGGRSIR